VPDVDGGVGQRFAGAYIQHRQLELEGQARFAFSYVAAQDFIGHVERPDLLLGCNRVAHGRSLRQTERRSCALQLECRSKANTALEKNSSTDTRPLDHFINVGNDVYKIDSLSGVKPTSG
jgi:hypothetical protein